MRLLIGLLVFFTPLFSTGQSLSLDDLIKIQKMDIRKVNDFLTTKGWEYDGITKRNADSIHDKIKWAHSVSYYQGKKHVIASLVYLSDDTEERAGYDNYIEFMTVDKNIVNEIKAQIKKYNMSLIKTYTEDDYLELCYRGQNYTICVTSFKKLIDRPAAYRFELTTNLFFKQRELMHELGALE